MHIYPTPTPNPTPNPNPIHTSKPDPLSQACHTKGIPIRLVTEGSVAKLIHDEGDCYG